MILNDLNESTFGGIFDAIALMTGHSSVGVVAKLLDKLSGKSQTFGRIIASIFNRVWGVGKFVCHLPGVIWWWLRKVARLRYGQSVKGMHPELKSHLAFALKVIERKVPLRVTWLFARFGTTLPIHQAPLFRLGQKLLWANLMVHTTLWVHQFGDALETEAALNELAHLRRLLLTPEPTEKDDARGRNIAKRILAGECRMLNDVPVSTKIPLVYHEPALGPNQPIPEPDPRLGRHEEKKPTS
jgi:hypothetical protein